ncbi:MAG: twin-arginine translocase TatA/TatE family subunit [Desulfobacterales bacterium]
MFGIGMPELIIILVIILIIFGAGKLPEIGGGMGKAIRNFKKATHEVEKDKLQPDPEKIPDSEKKAASEADQEKKEA